MNSKKQHSCIILCGGQSRRMGQDKGSMIIQDKPMINHILSTLNNEINEVIIVLNNKDRIDKYKNFIKKEDYNFKITFAEDEIKNIGPMSGILTGLKHITSDYALILPCDSPYVTEKLIENIFNELDSDHHSKNKLKTSEPLHSVYNKNIIPEIEELISDDILHIKGLIEKIDAKFILIDNKKLLKKEFSGIKKLKYGMYNYRTKALKILIWAFFRRRNSYSDLRCFWSADTFCWQNLFNYLSIRYQEK